MNYRAYWQFYKAIFPFVATFGIIAFVFFGVFWGYGLFSTLGLLVGFAGFQFFRKEEYYLYYNMGLTKWSLFTTSFIINIICGLPAFLILLSFNYLIFGAVTST